MACLSLAPVLRNGRSGVCQLTAVLEGQAVHWQAKQPQPTRELPTTGGHASSGDLLAITMTQFDAVSTD